MSTSDDFRAVVARLRGWGFKVREESGCYGRSNGGSWSAGKPVGHVNHHYVCSLTSSQSYIDGLVSNLVNGTVVNWFADVNGACYLIGTGPMNHAGTGNQYTLDAVRADRPPPYSPARDAGSISGNSHYSGTECQHPGDSTPWPTPLLRVMVAINAAEFLQWGYTANRAIDHYEHTSRKIDMSAGGGVDSGGWAGEQLRLHVAAVMSGTPIEPDPEPEPEPEPAEDDDVMQLLRIAGGDGKVYAANVVGRRFYYIGNPDSLQANQLAGTYSAEIKEIDQGQMNHVRYACQIQGDDDPAASIP
jgi:hypothetical protein